MSCVTRNVPKAPDPLACIRRSGMTSRLKCASFSRNQTSWSSIGPRGPAVTAFSLFATGAPAAVVSGFVLSEIFLLLFVKTSVHRLRIPPTTLGPASGTQAPVRHLYVVHGEPVILGRPGTRGALRDIDVGDRAARAADHVLMVVPGPALEPCRGTRQVDPSCQSRVDERPEHVVRLGSKPRRCVCEPG